MGKRLDAITPQLQEFINEQHIFFVATATADSRINLSPKGLDSFYIQDKNTVLWLNLTGSGNETAAHLLENDRMTIMFCSFEKNPMILRLYGYAKAYHKEDQKYKEYATLFPDHPGARQIFKVKVDLVQTSCGFAVPFMGYQGERDTLNTWAEKKGEDGIHDYWEEKNVKTLDGKPTGIPL
ncbi:MAG: pyridoxamine 5'-phosphate oxidase family protein [Leeuwenhoekiella sp.]